MDVLAAVVPHAERRRRPSLLQPGNLALFARLDDATLLGYGVPAPWLGSVRAAGEDELFDLVDHLPQEAAEALIERSRPV